MPTNVPSRKANYIVKGVETVVAGRDIQARIFTLAPGDIIPWHSHSEITDYFFVLSGRLIVETRAPDDHHALGPGDRYQVAAGTPHQTANRDASDCRFLIIQGVGKYDWIKEG